MGILDRIDEARQRAIRQELADKNAEAARRIVEKQIYDKLLTSQITHYLEDSATLIDLLDGLPKIDFDQYLKQVASYVGYDVRVGIYSHPEPIVNPDHPSATRVSEYQQYVELAFRRAKLRPSSQLARYSEIYPPKTSFFGDNATITAQTGFFGVSSEFSFQEPGTVGIGINFHRVNGISKEQIVGRYQRNGQYERGGNDMVYTHEDVYVRISSQNDTLVTCDLGQGRFEFRQLEQLDDVLEEAIKHPLISIEEKFVPEYIPDYGSE